MTGNGYRHQHVRDALIEDQQRDRRALLGIYAIGFVGAVVVVGCICWAIAKVAAAAAGSCS